MRNILLFLFCLASASADTLNFTVNKISDSRFAIGYTVSGSDIPSGFIMGISLSSGAKFSDITVNSSFPINPLKPAIGALSGCQIEQNPDSLIDSGGPGNSYADLQFFVQGQDTDISSYDPRDLNEDTQLNLCDTYLMLSNWGNAYAHLGDLNDDRQIDYKDYSLLVTGRNPVPVSMDNLVTFTVDIPTHNAVTVSVNPVVVYGSNGNVISASAATFTLQPRLYILVDASGSGDYTSIQDGVNHAQPGERVIVSPGTYNEQVTLTGKNIILTSSNPEDLRIVKQTVINAMNFPYPCLAVGFRGTEEPNCVLNGFNIKGAVSGYKLDLPPDWDPSDPLPTPCYTRATIKNCILSGVSNGTGRVIEGCDGLIQNCLIADNRSTCLCGIQPAVLNCHGVIRNCTVNYGTGIQVDDGGSVNIENCITSVRFLNGSQAHIQYSMITTLWDFSQGSYTFGPGCIFGEDPQFVRLGAWNGENYVEGDYHLKSVYGHWIAFGGGVIWPKDSVTSPAIDAGNPAMGPLAEPSPNGGRIDLGFYGGTSQASKSLSGGCYKIADLTNDHSVDVADLFWFAQFWLDNNPFAPADLNRDQRVNLNDFGTLSQSWLQ